MDVMILKSVNDSTWVLLNGNSVVARNNGDPNKSFDWEILISLSELDKEVVQHYCAEMYYAQSLIKEIVK